MPDVFCCRGVNSGLGDVGRVVTSAFKTARDQDQVQIARQLVTVLHHSFGQLPVCSDIHVVESLIPTNDCSCELDIFPHERVMLSLNIDIAWAWMGTIKFTSLNGGRPFNLRADSAILVASSATRLMLGESFITETTSLRSDAN